MSDIYESAAEGRAQFRNAYREECNKVKALAERIEDLESALKKHHTGIGCINYCRTCGGHFSWEDPNVVVSFTDSGETKS